MAPENAAAPDDLDAMEAEEIDAWVSRRPKRPALNECPAHLHHATALGVTGPLPQRRWKVIP